MKLIELTIEYSELQLGLFPKVQSISYNFQGEKILITSENENSKGKTTLIRFLLYALGYKVTQTDGMSIYSYKTSLEVNYKGEQYFFLRNRDEQCILDKNKNEKYKRIANNENYIPMINILLGIKNDYIADSLLGCFYIDQDKGWTLLNRGICIGSYKFNIEEFFINLDGKFNIEKNFNENRMLDIDIKRANSLLNILKDNYIYNDELIENRKEILEAIIDLENEKNSLEQILHIKKREIRNLKNLLSQNEEFVKRIENMNIIIEYKGENIIVDKYKLKGYSFNNDILKMRKTELEIETKKIEKEIEKFKTQIKQIRKNNQQDNSSQYLKRVFNLVKTSGITIEELELLKNSSSSQIRKNNKVIKKEISDNVDEFWEILHPILKDFELGKKYIEKEIILIDKLIGISGTQLHQLSLAFKIALNKLIEKRLNIRLPFIIDSPKGSETSDRISDLMLKSVYKHLPNHQVIISSAFNNFDIEFDKKIILIDGVVKELNKFI